jgi:hypothetical protein
VGAFISPYRALAASLRVEGQGTPLPFFLLPPASTTLFASPLFFI